MRHKTALATALIAALAAASLAQEDRSALPLPDPPFNGEIGETFETATPDFPQPAAAPEGAPNVVIILIDDLGFGQPGTFGGPIPTPEMDELAARGLRYNRFHTTAICSPTRAALLTGRNHHEVASGTITELATGFPGYNSVWPKSTASIARILRDNGYSTAAWGKWHNTPDWETSPVGPFLHWPTGLGFEYWYGFHGGETSQWEPQLFRNELAVEPPARPEDGYHLTTDLADDAIAWLGRQHALAPDKPYLIYFATGATHAPLHAPEAWIDKFQGRFDQGWDAVREQTLARQKEMGLVPPDTRLTPRPEQIEAWDTLDDDAKRLYARHQEAFAGFLAHTDHEIGRLLDAAMALPDADNTLVFLIAGDNGPSAEGSVTGTLNNIMTQNGIPDTVEAQLAVIDELGGPLHENHYPVGWAWAGSAPFQWMKRVPSHFGGTRNGMIVSWPKRITDVGGVRTQFGHVIDVAPTILRAAGLPEPATVDGIEQRPMAGADMGATFTDAHAPEFRTTQYFETGGHRAIYHDGWVAASFHGAPWVLTGSVGFEDNTWELYNIEDDFAQAVDLAGQNPGKLEELRAVFDQQAAERQVYPLDDRFAERAAAAGRPSLTAGRDTFAYPAGVTRIPEGSAPPVYQRSHAITATFEYARGDEGVLVACGGSSAGYTLYVEDGRVHYAYNFFGRAVYDIASTSALPEGAVEVVVTYEQEPFEPFVEFFGGTVTLAVNGEPAGSGRVERAAPVRFSATETMDIGMDLGSVVSPAYRDRAPFAFTGAIEKVVVEVR